MNVYVNEYLVACMAVHHMQATYNAFFSLWPLCQPFRSLLSNFLILYRTQYVSLAHSVLGRQGLPSVSLKCPTLPEVPKVCYSIAQGCLRDKNFFSWVQATLTTATSADPSRKQPGPSHASIGMAPFCTMKFHPRSAGV